LSDYLKAAELFETSLDTSCYFESIVSEHTKNRLLKTIEKKNIALIFLLGEPGVGKSYMLEVLQKSFSPQKKVLFSSEPFATPESLLLFLLEGDADASSLGVVELKERVIKKFQQSDNIIILDEAQLLSSVVLEYIRILSDTKHFTFLLSMHKNEGEAIVKKSHFASRNNVVINMSGLKKDEISNYLKSQLQRNALESIAELFKKKQINELMVLSKGNFRVLKQLLKHTFMIMDYAKKNAHQKYTQPTLFVITMAAIDLGVIDV